MAGSNLQVARPVVQGGPAAETGPAVRPAELRALPRVRGGPRVRLHLLHRLGLQGYKPLRCVTLETHQQQDGRVPSHGLVRINE